MCPEDPEHADGIRSFYQVSNLPGSQTTGEQVDASLAHIELPPASLICAVAQRLRRNLGLRLFNFDIIREEASQKQLYIVDINYFPGYAKMPRYEHVLSDFFVTLMHEKAGGKAEKEEGEEEVPPFVEERLVCC